MKTTKKKRRNEIKAFKQPYAARFRFNSAHLFNYRCINLYTNQPNIFPWCWKYAGMPWQRQQAKEMCKYFSDAAVLSTKFISLHKAEDTKCLFTFDSKMTHALKMRAGDSERGKDISECVCFYFVWSRKYDGMLYNVCVCVCLDEIGSFFLYHKINNCNVCHIPDHRQFECVCVRCNNNQTTEKFAYFKEAKFLTLELLGRQKPKK